MTSADRSGAKATARAWTPSDSPSVSHAPVPGDTLDEAQRSRLRTIAHDLKTPFAQALLNLDRLILTTADDEAALTASKVRDILLRIGEGISAMTETTRYNAETDTIKTAPVYLPGLVREVVADVLNTEIGEDHQVSFHLEPSARHAVIMGSRALLRRAVLNLIRNSVKHNPSGCAITVTLSVAEPGQALIRVADDGAGASPDHVADLRARIEALAQQVDALPADHLGLFIVNEIAHHHRGTLAFDSAPGAGFAVELGLPLLDSLGE